jgi:hypothetical protein
MAALSRWLLAYAAAHTVAVVALAFSPFDSFIGFPGCVIRPLQAYTSSDWVFDPISGLPGDLLNLSAITLPTLLVLTLVAQRVPRRRALILGVGAMTCFLVGAQLATPLEIWTKNSLQTFCYRGSIAWTAGAGAILGLAFWRLASWPHLRKR